MEEMQDKNTSNKSEHDKIVWIWRVMLVVCVLGVLIAVGSLIYGTLKRRHEEQLLEQLAAQTQPKDSVESDMVTIPIETPEPEVIMLWEDVWPDLTLEEKTQLLETYFGFDIPDKNIDFTVLREETNPDIYAWIYIPDTKIDYPVLRHPEDNSYYLNYNIDGSKGYPGCIYTENYNAKDFTDYNTVMYGHNMYNGTMFGGLHQYEDSEFFSEHPYVYVYTEDEVYVYRVFAAYEFSDIHLLNGYSVDTEEGFFSYLEVVMAACSMNGNHDESIQVTSKDKIITLSTCTDNEPDKRYLVQGLLMRMRGRVDDAYALGESE